MPSPAMSLRVHFTISASTPVSPLSSAMVRQIPFPQGRDIYGSLPFPISNMLERQVAKPLASFTWLVLT